MIMKDSISTMAPLVEEASHSRGLIMLNDSAILRRPITAMRVLGQMVRRHVFEMRGTGMREIIPKGQTVSHIRSGKDHIGGFSVFRCDGNLYVTRDDIHRAIALQGPTLLTTIFITTSVVVIFIIFILFLFT